MTFLASRVTGVALILVVLAAGVLFGRIIEAIAVAAVLFALWTSVRRLLSAPTDGTDRRGDARS